MFRLIFSMDSCKRTIFENTILTTTTLLAFEEYSLSIRDDYLMQIFEVLENI